MKVASNEINNFSQPGRDIEYIMRMQQSITLTMTTSFAAWSHVLNTANCVAFATIQQKRADVVGAEALYKRAGAIDPFHANSIYNYAVLLDSSLKQQQVGRRPRRLYRIL